MPQESQPKTRGLPGAQAARTAELVSYSEAMMYQPTHGILIIPTYGGGPASWGPKPVIKQDTRV